MKQSSFLACTIFIVVLSAVRGYDIVGAWQLVAQPGKYQFISDSLTFQFAKSADTTGSINTKLFVYDCFLSQFLYEVSEDEVSINFQTSSLLTPQCTLNGINQLRSLVKKIFFFEIMFDRLFLLGLNQQTVFQLKRQKYNYAELMSGTWTMSNDQGTTDNSVKINGSNINLCKDQAQISYTLSTINGSYPRITTTQLDNSRCPNAALNTFERTLFIRVAENLTQLSLYDSTSNYFMTLDQVAKSSPNQALPSINTVQSIANNVRNESNILVTTYVPPPKISDPPANTQPQQPYQPPTVISSQTPSNTVIPQQTKPQQRSESAQATSSAQQSPSPSQGLQAPSAIPQSSTSNISISWNFNQNGAFGGSFSSSPLFSSDSTTLINSNKPTNNNTQNPFSNAAVSNQQQTQEASKTLNQQQKQLNDQGQYFSGFTLSDLFFSSSTNSEFVTQSTNNNSAQSNPTDNPALQSQTDQPIPMTVSSTSNVSQLISLSMNSGTSGMTTSDFVLSNKWLLTWLNGYNSLGKFSRVYIIFTSTKIILYCPCNTYYTSYRLQGSTLQGISWLGTSNQCENNNDRQVTDYVFYSNTLRQKGVNLGFYYNSQAQLAEFKPYY